LKTTDRYSPERPRTHHPLRPERRVATVNPEIFFRGGAPDPGGGPPQGGERGRRKRGKEEGGEGEKKGKRVYRRPRKLAPFLEADTPRSPHLPGVRVPPGREPQRRSPCVDGPPPCDSRSPRTPTTVRGETSGGVDRPTAVPSIPEAPRANPRERRGAKRARCGPVEPPARQSDPLRHPPREEEGRWGESLGGLPLRKKKTGRLRADAQRIVVTRLLYRVHDPTEQPSRMQGF
jgi:hypothetical protein